jgi:DNA-binding transcriptional LysR family regulator
MDRLEAMSTFLAVVEAGSLSAASRRLNTPLATVSRKISELESRLRTKLFDRTTHKLVLTGAGSSYVDACKRILAEVSEAERAASGEYVAPTGELTVTAPVGIGRIYLIPILADFFKAYPEIDASLIITNRVLNLQQEQIDVGVRLGALPDSSIIAIRVGIVRRAVCASPAYLAARGTPRTPDDLAGHDCVTFAGSVTPDVWTFVRDETNVAVSVHGRLAVDTVEAAVDAACAGIGIASGFSYYAKTALERGALTTLLDEFQPAPLPVHLVYTANQFLPIKVRAFLDFAAPRLRQVFAE